MELNEIQSALWMEQDTGYKSFHEKLVPNIDCSRIIGVRIPVIRKMAKQLGFRQDFVSELPHYFYEEYQLHACMLNNIRDFDAALQAVNAFLPYVDNWATCDILNPLAFKKNPARLLHYAMEWAKSEQTYTMRFGVEMLMNHCLSEYFSPAQSDLVASLRPVDYYGRMMIAWYFATALAKQYDSVIPYLQNRRLDRWTHNKTIQKAVESYRILPEQKESLKSLRWK